MPTPIAFETAPSSVSRWGRRSVAHIIGVTVSETTAETLMATARVTENSRKSRPTMPPMNKSGMKTAKSETVIETIVKPICFAPSIADS
jgi:hypothetical protein